MHCTTVSRLCRTMDDLDQRKRENYRQTKKKRVVCLLVRHSKCQKFYTDTVFQFEILPESARLQPTKMFNKTA